MAGNNPRGERRRVALLPGVTSAPTPASNIFQASANQASSVALGDESDKVSGMWQRVEHALYHDQELEVLFPATGPDAAASWSTVLAMRAQIVQAEVKRTMHTHRKDLPKFVDRYK
jgi:hypothetical protein